MVQVGIREILTLAWDYPLYTGGLALMFTTPMFRVIVFFSPVLICTALCAVALISVGQQIEVARDKGVAGPIAKIMDGEGLSARPGSATGRRNVGLNLEDSWLKFVQGLEQGVYASNNETERSNWMNNVNKEEEGLKKYAYRVAEGPVQFLNDQDRLDHLDRQIEAFREYERKFREKARTEPMAAVAFPKSNATGPRNVGPGEDSWLKSAQGLEPAVSASNNETERSNWVNYVNKDKEGRKKNAYRVAEGPMQFLNEQDRLDHLDRQVEAFREYEKKFREKTRTEPRAAGASATVEAWKAGALPGIRSSPSAGIISAPEERHSNCDVPTRKIPPVVLYNLRTGGTGKATMNSSGAGAPAALSSWASGSPAAVTGSRKEAIVAEGFSYDSFDRFSRNDNVLESSSGKQRGTEPSAPLLPLSMQKPTSVFEKDTIATTPAVEMQARSFATVKNLKHNAPVKNADWYDSIKPDHRLDGELAGFTSKTFGVKEKDIRKASVFARQGPAIVFSSVKCPAKSSEESDRAPTGKESRRSRSAPRSPLNDLTRVASPAKHSEDRSLRRATTCNSSLRSRNAVIYNGGSDSSVVSLRRKGSGSVQRRKIQ